MFSKEEAKQIRQDFWIFFDKRYPRKWLLYNTKIKDVSLKFSFDTKKAIVSLDAESTDAFYRDYYFDKFESLKGLLLDEVSNQLIFKKDYELESGKHIHRVYIQIDNVSIHNKHTWPEVFDFFNNYMDKLETFFLTYKDIIDA